MTTATVEAAPAVAWLQKDGAWGSWIRVEIAATPEADAAAAAFFRSASTLETGHAACVDEDATDPAALGPAMESVFYPTCAHGMSAQLCYGPNHYPTDAELAR